MFSVLVIYGGEGDAQRYRCQHLREQLQIYGINCDLVEFRNQPLWHNINYQFVIFHRVPLDRWLEKFIKQLKKAGIIVLFDTDDLIFDISQLNWVRSLAGSDKLRRALYADEVQRYRAMLLASDGALVSTDFLQSQVRRLGKPAWVHRNAFSLELLTNSTDEAPEKPQNSSNKVIIGYASGTPTHDRDFEVAKPALQIIMREFPFVELHVIGYLNIGSDWESEKHRIKHIPFVAWQKLPQLLAQLDINLAPLELNNPFCAAKSELKYIEASLVRVPTIASNTEAFQFAINENNGLLADSVSEWVVALRKLIENPNLREEIGLQAYTDALKRYHPITRGRELIQTFNHIYQTATNKPLFSEINIHPPLTCTEKAENDESPFISTTNNISAPPLWQRAQYALQNKGFRVLFLQFALYVRRQVIGK